MSRSFFRIYGIAIVYIIYLVYAQNLHAQHVVLKTNVLSILSGNYGASAEFAVGKKIGISITGNYVSTKKGDDTQFSTTEHETGYNVIPEARFYLSNRIDGGSLQGLYVGPNLIYEKLKVKITNPQPDSTTVEGQVTNFGYGVIVGHQWIFKERFAVDLFFNPYFNSPSISGEIATTTPQRYEGNRGIQFRRIGVAVGIAF
ncbi:MAG: DUF3575 domain-containing protein [Sphingobacteriales bacterium]|nr:MAG: DUF3575 domain-containing protein [Sphingobacteriales bacterium]